MQSEPTMFNYFQHVTKPQYRIVLECGRALPSGLKPEDWEVVEVRPFERVHNEIVREIEKRGVGAYQQFIRPHELP